MARCECMTQNHTRCSLRAKDGSPFCSMHSKKECKRRSTPRKAVAGAVGSTISAEFSVPSRNVIDVLQATPVVLPADAARPVSDADVGTYKVVDAHYQRYLVEFNGAPFLKDGKPTRKWVYNYPMPAVTVDLVVFDPTLSKVLLIQRGASTEPKIYASQWAVPGGFMEPDENATQAAIREFNEEVSATVHVDPGTVFHVYTATVPTRDVRQRTVSVVFTTILDPKDVSGAPVDEQEIGAWRWQDVDAIIQGSLAFDHKNLVARALTTQKVMQQLNPTARRLLQSASTDLHLADLDKGKRS